VRRGGGRRVDLKAVQRVEGLVHEEADDGEKKNEGVLQVVDMR
jgi:hypothetical protein